MSENKIIKLLEYIAEKSWGGLETARFEIKNDEAFMRCPVCGDSKKSKKKRRLGINLSTGVAHCFNCGWSGTIYSLMKEIELEPPTDISLSLFKERYKNNINDIIKDPPQKLPKGLLLSQFISHFKEIEDNELKKKGYEILIYLKTRGVKKEFFKYFYIPLDKYWEDYVLLLYQYKGQINFQGNLYKKTNKNKYLHRKNGKYTPAFVELVSKEKGNIVYITEGFYDALILNQENYNAICVFGLGNMKLEKIPKEVTTKFDIVWLPDNDKTLSIFLNHIHSNDYLKILPFVKDINEFYLKHKQDFRMRFNAIPITKKIVLEMRNKLEVLK